MTKRKPIPAPPPAPPACPVCTTPRRCGTPCLHVKGPRCLGRDGGPDECDCINWCGDDPWLHNGRARGCAKFYGRPENKPRPIYPRIVLEQSRTIVGPFSPLPYDL